MSIEESSHRIKISGENSISKVEDKRISKRRLISRGQKDVSEPGTIK